MDGKLRNMTSAYISSGNKLLLLYRIGSRVVSPSWCGVGGHFEQFELNDAHACVLRELREEMSIDESDLEGLRLRYVTQRLKNGEIRQNYYFFAELKSDANIKLVCSEGIPKWIDFEELSDLEMPFSAKCVLEHYLRIGKDSDCIYSGATTPEGAVFTELAEF